ncbi:MULTISPECIES: hypothetical protein [Microbacterium]|uniref:hypothetical protein n=1 Tax=Microbacterium TaxID=33882 RepID=UPI00277FA3E2|nr:MULTISPECIES: hypothetical protein [Microbacterium]MDQ1083807.1 putative negative regulator of RcsB-dependent stress response [Microbacterium sp. SORGH_AS_0344]MDQ1170914.1 putative negative regulator of RcsB-dependent stress response [Microbacterium proteolyticum]
MTPEPGDVAGGPGWVIGGDLRPRITDAAVFRAGLEGDALADVIEALWNGEPERALRLLGDPTTIRMRALHADCLAATGDTAAALTVYDALVDEVAGTSREAVIRQHRGKVLLAAGRTHAAVADFARALALRRDADPTLRASSEHALAAARRRIDATTEDHDEPRGHPDEREARA